MLGPFNLPLLQDNRFLNLIPNKLSVTKSQPESIGMNLLHEQPSFLELDGEPWIFVNHVSITFDNFLILQN